MLSNIIVNGVSFELANGRQLFNKINFTLNSNITILIGPNGVGKTTLAKLIAGDFLPSEGHIYRHQTVSFLAQREETSNITVEDYLSTRYSWSILGERLLQDIDRSHACSKLSGGQWMRVRLASCIGEDFLILDEPTNDLDKEGKDILRSFLAEYSHGVLLISHDREFLQLCDEVLELSNQGLTKYGGGWANYEEEKKHERSRAEQILTRAKNEREKAKVHRTDQIEKQEGRNRCGRKVAEKGGLPKILLGARKRRAQETTGRIDSSTADRAHNKVREAYEVFNQLKIEPVMYADLMGGGIPNQKLVAEAKSFNIFLDKWLYKENLSFSWQGPIRVAIKGINGSGKTTLIRALQGTSFKTQGELNGGPLKSLYLDQQCSVLNETESILENIRATTHKAESEIRNGLAKFLFTGESVFQPVSSLSGGERLRTALACAFLSKDKPELLILDEPTNNLDMQNIQFLENLISQFEGAIIIISHDEIFLQNCGVTSELQL